MFLHALCNRIACSSFLLCPLKPLRLFLCPERQRKQSALFCCRKSLLLGKSFSASNCEVTEALWFVVFIRLTSMANFLTFKEISARLPSQFPQRVSFF
jgi:hypothetical protein